jgi:hypothetical protein
MVLDGHGISLGSYGYLVWCDFLSDWASKQPTTPGIAPREAVGCRSFIWPSFADSSDDEGCDVVTCCLCVIIIAQIGCFVCRQGWTFFLRGDLDIPCRGRLTPSPDPSHEGRGMGRGGSNPLPFARFAGAPSHGGEGDLDDFAGNRKSRYNDGVAKGSRDRIWRKWMEISIKYCVE